MGQNALTELKKPKKREMISLIALRPINPSWVISSLFDDPLEVTLRLFAVSMPWLLAVVCSLLELDVTLESG